MFDLPPRVLLYCLGLVWSWSGTSSAIRFIPQFSSNRILSVSLGWLCQKGHLTPHHEEHGTLGSGRSYKKLSWHLHCKYQNVFKECKVVSSFPPLMYTFLLKKVKWIRQCHIVKKLWAQKLSKWCHSICNDVYINVVPGGFYFKSSKNEMPKAFSLTLLFSASCLFLVTLPARGQNIFGFNEGHQNIVSILR